MATSTKSRRKTQRIIYGPRTSGILMTPEEYDAIDPDSCVRGFRYELINGVFVVTPPVDLAERDPNEYLAYLLMSYKENHPQGSVLDFTVNESDVADNSQRRRCDRAIWVGLGRLPDPSKDVPTIVVEFVSKSKRDFVRDYEQKRDEYLAAGVKEYWIIDRFRRIMTVHRPGVAPLVVLESLLYTTELLPEFELPLARLLERADRWKKTRTPKVNPGDTK